VKGLSRETHMLLDRGRGQTLEPEHRARLKRSVLAGAVGVSVAATTLTASWTATAAKLAAILLVAGGATAVIALGTGGTGTGTRTSPKPNQAPQARSTESASVVHVVAPAKPLPEPVAPAPTGVDVPVPAATEGSRSLPSIKTRPAATSVVARTEGTEGPSGAPVSSSLQEEALLIREANAALESGDAKRSLTLAEEYARRFPDGALLPEGSAVHIFALCQAGQMGRARTETRAFLAAHPEGPLSMRVRSSCGGGSL
jgi:hypothetical protein